jgi:LCP family protein required for cell wall assembly
MAQVKSNSFPSNYRPPKKIRGPSNPDHKTKKATKGAASFPDVGMTLRSYSLEMSDAAARPTRNAAGVVKTSRWRRIRSKVSIKRFVLLLLVLILGTGGFLGYKFVYNTHKVFGGSILSVLSTTKLKGEDTGRVNILLAGNSSDDVGHDGADLTDSIMIISIDTKNNTAFLLSIPRDTWVDIPGAGHQKINDAYVVGQNDSFSQSGYPNGGMGLLEEVIQQNFDISMDYYALVNYGAFRDAVNAVGGIQVNIQSSDPRGLYDPSRDYVTHTPLVKLTNGEHTLTGEQALDLARARGDTYGSYGYAQSDFERTQNQRLMIVALKTKAETAGVLANPAKLASLADAIGSNVTTDMKLSEVHRLYDIVKPITNSNIASLSLNNANGKDLLASYTSPDGEEALIPALGLDDFDDIQAYIKQQTSSDPVVREGASLVVLNGTATFGLASQEKTNLTAKNFDVTTVGDTTEPIPMTTIIDASNGMKPNTLAALKAIYPDATITTTNPYAGVYTADFIIELGNDQTSKATNPNP